MTLIYNNHIGYGPADPSWDAYLARASDGFNAGLPLAAGIAAWCGYRYRRSALRRTFVVRRPTLRIAWAYTWPLFAGVFVGFALIVLQQVQEEPPVTGVQTPLLLATFAAMTVTAVAFGWLLGAVLHAVIATPLAVFLTYQWSLYPQLDSSNFSWRNMAGYSIYSCCDVVYYSPDIRAVVGPIAIAVGIVVAAFLVTRFGVLRAAMPALAAIAVTALLANGIVTGTNALARTERPKSELTCMGSAPELCLYPEQFAAGTGKRLQAAWETARSNRVDLHRG